MSKYLFKAVIYLTRIFLIAIPVILIVWLFSKDLVVSGQIEAVYNFDELSPFITTLRPQSRVEEPISDDQGNYWQQIKDEPVYFDVRLPRHFDKAEVTINYKNLDQSVFELGVLADKKNWIFDLKPVFNITLDKLFADKLNWSRLQENSIVLFQKDQRYQKIEEFLNNPPSPEKVASYNYKLENKFILPNYFVRNKGIEINKSLRGSHRLLTYIKNETLDFNFLIQDVNRHLGEDYLNIAVYDDSGDLLQTKFLKDDGNITDDGKLSEVKEININIPNLTEGLYRIELQANNDDIFIRQIKTSQYLLVFENLIYLADNVGYSDKYIDERKNPTKLYSNGFRFIAFTPHKEGIQSIGVGDEVLRILETHKDSEVVTEFGNKYIVVPRNDVKLTTQGLFSFTADSFFDPIPSSLKYGQSFDEKKVKYVIANYQPPDTLSGGQKKTVVFDDLKKYYTEDDKLHFVLSLPAMQEGDEGILIDQIRVELTRQPSSIKNLFYKFKEKLKVKL